MKRARFISDLHIPPEMVGGQKEVVNALEGFLDDCLIEGVSDIYVLGDLFAYWYETASRTAGGFEQPLEMLRGFTRRGLRVNVLPGNRDFLLGPRFCERTGCGVFGEEVELDLGGLRAALLHGDRLSSFDRRYQRWRTFSRGPFFRRMLSGMPEPAMRRLAFGALRGSAFEKSLKPRRTMLMSRAGLLDVFAGGVDVILVGHVHEPGEVELELPDGRTGRVVMLGEWAPGRVGAWAEWLDGALTLRHPRGADSC